MRRTAVCAALAATTVLAHPGQAATTGLSFTDPLGDANGVNDQAFGLPVPSTSTPADLASADITKVAFQTLYNKRTRKPSAIQVTVTLAAAPDKTTDYNINATVPDGCDGGSGTALNLQYEAAGGLSPSTVVNCNGKATTGTAIGLGPAVVDAAKHTITWTVDGTGFKPKGTVDSITVQSTVFVVGIYDSATADRTYRYQ